MTAVFNSPGLSVTIDVSKLLKLEANATNLVNDALGRAALNAGRQAQANIRTIGAIDTGYMINTTQARQLGSLRWSVGTAAEYGFFIEYGTRFTSPRPWLEPAIRDVRKSFGDALSNALKRAV